MQQWWIPPLVLERGCKKGISECCPRLGEGALSNIQWWISSASGGNLVLQYGTQPFGFGVVAQEQGTRVVGNQTFALAEFGG